MSRAAQNNAQNTYNQSSDLTNSSETKANGLYDQLAPTFTQEAVNPQGYGTQTLADMNTASQQSVGGALGAATGQATRAGAANRNAGSFAPVLGETARDSARTLSDNALKINNNNAVLKEGQRQAGLSGLSGLEGQENNNVLSSLGLQTQANNSLVNAGQSGWFQNMTGFMNAAANDGKAAAGLGLKF